MLVATPIVLSIATGLRFVFSVDVYEKCCKATNAVIVVSDPATNAVSNALGGKGFSVLTPMARNMSAPTIPESKIPQSASSAF